jgi:hypothetical protein
MHYTVLHSQHITPFPNCTICCFERCFDLFEMFKKIIRNGNDNAEMFKGIDILALPTH